MSGEVYLLVELTRRASCAWMLCAIGRVKYLSNPCVFSRFWPSSLANNQIIILLGKTTSVGSLLCKLTGTRCDDLGTLVAIPDFDANSIDPREDDITYIRSEVSLMNSMSYLQSLAYRLLILNL